MRRLQLIALLNIVLLLTLPFASALSISNVRVTDINDGSAVVRWNTDDEADSKVEFGTAALDRNAYNALLVRNHSVALTTLNPTTAYKLKVRSGSAADDNGGALYSFTTTADDTVAPRIDVNVPPLLNELKVDIVGETEAEAVLKLFVNTVLVKTSVSLNGRIEFTDVRLDAGENTLRIDAVDASGNSNSRAFTITVDVSVPKITLTQALPGVSEADTIAVKGTVSERAAVVVTVNNHSVFEQEAEAFDVTVNLDEGENRIMLTATDSAGNVDRVEHVVLVDTEPPELVDVMPLEEQPFYYEGRATDTVRGKTEPGARVYLFVSYDGFGASAAVGPGGGASASYGPFSGTPTAKDVIDKAQFKTTADSNGNFKFDDVNFQHPGGAEAVAPREVPAGTEGLGGEQRVSQLQQDTRTVRVYITVVDGVGLSTVNDYVVDIGSCFSGSFDFSVKTLRGYQFPSALQPQRLDSGTEIVSFVLDINYSGRAGNNRRDPNAQRVDDDYYEINSVTLERACGRADNDFFERDPSYQYACQITPNRPTVSQPTNPEGTKWFFRYNLGATDKFTDFNKDFWKALRDNELKFPFKVTIQYDEKLVGRETQPSKAQTVCREVSYFVDVPVDPRRVLPDFLLEDGQKAINDTLNVINDIMPKLDEIIHYVGIGCLSSFGLRTVVQWYRRFIQEWEFLKCKGLELGGLGKECPLQNRNQIDACFYLKEGSDVPYPPTALPPNAAQWKCDGIKDNRGNVRRDMETSPIITEHFSGTLSAWRSEASLFKAYRYLCDRHFCRDVPARWTQEVDVGEIKQQIYAQQQCAADTPSVSTLKPIQNCWEEHGIKQQTITQFANQQLLVENGNVCYEYLGAIYQVAEKSSSQCGQVGDGSTNADLLLRIDNRQYITNIASLETQPQRMCAIRVSNTYYTADVRECRAGSGGVCGGEDQALCATKDDSRVLGWYPAGPTKDCWEGAPGGRRELQCFCSKAGSLSKSEENKRATIIAQGATYAGTETGKVKYAGGNEKVGVADGGKWPWNYREWQIYDQTNHQAGIYYPEERYYDKRDFPAAFGQNYLLDKFFGTRTPSVNPFTQDVGAVQSACLTTIRARLRLLQSILMGLQGCLKSVQTTGKADAGVCKEVFSQFVCNLAYKAVHALQNRCVPEPNSASVGKKAPDLKDALNVGSRALTDTLQQTQRELKEDYGNAALNNYFEGGTQNLMKKVCLAAFGVEAGLDFDGLIDGEYSAPFKSTATILSSEGAKGRREFLSFNPQNRYSVYEYRAAWLITAGCDLESYRIDLVAVNENERRQYPNVNCADVNDQEQGGQGCDNLRTGVTVQPHPFAQGNRVAAGSYIDENKAMNVDNSPYRYDHMKITLFVDSRQDAAKCIPDENRQGDTGVFYFPIYDATGQDVLQCDVSPNNGQFLCQSNELTGLGQAYIENVQCYNPRTGEYGRCDRVTLTQEDSDLVKARVSVFSSGESKFCMNTYVQTANTGNTPIMQVEIPGIGRPNSIPFDITLAKVDEQTFSGRGEGISLVKSSITLTDPCTWNLDTQYDIADATKKGGGQTAITFVKSGDGYKVTFEKDIEAINKPSEPDFDPKKAYTKTDLEKFSYRVRGYGIQSVVPVGDDNKVVCTFIPRIPKASVPQEQEWKLHFNLLYPDKRSNACLVNGAPLASVPNLAFDTKKIETIRVRNTKTETAAVSAYNNGKRLFNEARGGTTAQRMQRYESAVSEFGRVGISAPAEGTKEEFLSYWWAVAAYAHLWQLKQGDQNAQATMKQRLLATANIFARRLERIITVERDSTSSFVNPLKNMPEIRLAKAYIGEIEKEIGKDTKVNTLLLCGLANAKCDNPDECYQMEQAWKQLFEAVPEIKKNPPKYFNPEGITDGCADDTKDGVWQKDPIYKDPAGSGASGGGSTSAAASVSGTPTVPTDFDSVRDKFVGLLVDAITAERDLAAEIWRDVPEAYSAYAKSVLVNRLQLFQALESDYLRGIDELVNSIKPAQRSGVVQEARDAVAGTVAFAGTRANEVDGITESSRYAPLRLDTIRQLGVHANQKVALHARLLVAPSDSYLLVLTNKIPVLIRNRPNDIGFKFINNNWMWKNMGNTGGYNNKFYSLSVVLPDVLDPWYKQLVKQLQPISTDYNRGIEAIVAKAKDCSSSTGLEITDVTFDLSYSCTTVDAAEVKLKARNEPK